MTLLYLKKKKKKIIFPHPFTPIFVIFAPIITKKGCGNSAAQKKLIQKNIKMLFIQGNVWIIQEGDIKFFFIDTTKYAIDRKRREFA